MRSSGKPEIGDENRATGDDGNDRRRRRRRRPMLRAWLWGLLSVEIVAITIFGICTYMMVVRNQNVGEAAPPDVRNELYMAAARFSSLVLLGYMTIALIMSLLSFVLLVSWRFLRRRPVTSRAAVGWALGLMALLMGYKFIDYSLDSPFVLMNMWNHRPGIFLIGTISDAVPQWAPFVARAVFAAISLTIVVLAMIRYLDSLPRRRKIILVAATAVLPVLGVTLGLTAAIERRPAAPRRDPRPNILILASDGLRPDHLGIYGYELPTSRNIDEIGSSAVRFENCFVPQARTLPSWTSILTSSYPHTHGQRVTWPPRGNIKLSMPTLVEKLREAGYKTSVLADWAGGDFGKVKYGFDEVRVAPDAWNMFTLMAQGTLQGHPFLVAFADNPLGRLVFPEMVGMPVNPCPAALTDMTIDRLRDYAHDSRPFFMIVFYSETHAPYATRHPYYRHFANPAYSGLHKLAMYVPNYVDMSDGELDIGMFDPVQVRALYDGAVLSFDDQVGRVMRHLKELNLYDNTIIMITSDHGEDLFELPTSWGHGTFFFGPDCDSKIPLIISDPELRHLGPQVNQSHVSSLDIMPTLLERLEMPVPDHCEGISLHGAIFEGREIPQRELFFESGVWIGIEPELSGQRLRYPPVLDMLAMSPEPHGVLGIGQDHLNRIITAKHRMVRTSRWKLIYIPQVNGAEYYLYDTQKDPFCVSDVKDQHPAEFEHLKARLWEWMLHDKQRVRQGDHIMRPGQTIEQYIRPAASSAAKEQ